MCQIFRVHILGRKLQRNKKKVMARCIKQKSKGHGPASAEVLRFHTSGSEEGAASSSHLLSVSGILHWQEGEEEGVMVEGMGQKCPLLPLPPLHSPSLSLPKHSSLALRLADSVSFLWVLKRDRRGLCLTHHTAAKTKPGNQKANERWSILASLLNSYPSFILIHFRLWLVHWHKYPDCTKTQTDSLFQM